MIAKTPPRRSHRYWLRLARLFVVALLGALVLLPLALGAASMYGLTHPPCSPGGNPGDFNPHFESITFSSTHNLEIEGYFIPGTNGATIMIPPAFSGGRGSSLHYARVFNQAGFNVLTFESRVCTSQGWISLGYQEVDDVMAAYRYLLTRPDVDPARVGLHGFSSAGATSLMAMPRLPEIRSVSAEGGYHDYAALLGSLGEGTYFDRLYRFAAIGAYRLFTGGNIEDLSPINAIRQIGNRPVLLVYGSLEVSLPGARLMLARAQESGVPAELWVVEGATHGGYLTVAPEEFVRRVVGFHQAALGILPE
ncbi:MAG: prolyl oligopeptidase family serine peptidase [Anaerolineaceae bacterium]|nr:prolyl oligopeptidase family serine peptidase [Anaerolineaceae bacterium]